MKIHFTAKNCLKKIKIMTNIDSVGIIVRARRNTQVVEGTGFENRQGSQARAGSNPASSARKSKHNDYSLCFFILSQRLMAILCNE